MTATDLLENLMGRSVVVEIEGHRLLVDAPRGVLSPELRSALVAHKAELLDLLTADKARREAALRLVNHAGARLVCPCYPELMPPDTRYAILVPAVNDNADFRAALRILNLHLPVMPRTESLDYLRPKFEHDTVATVIGTARGAGSTPPHAAEGHHTEPPAIRWAEYHARKLDRIFQLQGRTGEPGRITAQTVKHGAAMPQRAVGAINDFVN